MPQHPFPSLLWLATAALVTALILRFAMRAVGVRDDLPFPGLVYRSTAPLVESFYRFFPLTNARFDHPAFEVAALVAAGVAIALALLVYAVALLFSNSRCVTS